MIGKCEPIEQAQSPGRRAKLCGINDDDGLRSGESIHEPKSQRSAVKGSQAWRRVRVAGEVTNDMYANTVIGKQRVA
jgi:hypothetical protein